MNIPEFMLLYDPSFKDYIEKKGLEDLYIEETANLDLLLKYRHEYDNLLEIKEEFDQPTNESKRITMLKKMYYENKNDSSK